MFIYATSAVEWLGVAVAPPNYFVAFCILQIAKGHPRLTQAAGLTPLRSAVLLGKAISTFHSGWCRYCPAISFSGFIPT